MADSADTQVSQLYVAMFGRAPDAGGLAYWASRLSGGETAQHLADAMYGTAPARAYFPDGASNSQIIGSFYVNVLGRTADAQGLAYWTDKLNAPGATPGSVISQMVDVVSHYTGTDPAGLASAALFDNRSDAALYYGENGGSIANATQVLTGITTDVQTVTAARSIDIASASGTTDVGGYDDITLGSIAADVVLTNVASGAALRVESGSQTHWVEVDPFDPSSNQALTVYLPDASMFGSLELRLGGQVDLDLISPSRAVSVAQTVYLSNAHLDSLEVAGGSDVYLRNGDPVPAGSPPNLTIDAAHIDDAAGLDGGSLSMSMSAGAAMTCGPGNDYVRTSGVGATVNGGDGNDWISAYDCTMIGGLGNDTFEPGTGTPIVADFVAGADSFSFDLVVTNHSSTVTYGSTSTNWGTWYSQQVSLAAGATYQDYLNAAAASKQPAPQYAAISWFQYAGDTYMVVDNSTSNTFVSGTDYVVKLTGLVDLSMLVYDTHTAMLG